MKIKKIIGTLGIVFLAVGLLSAPNNLRKTITLLWTPSSADAERYVLYVNPSPVLTVVTNSNGTVEYFAVSTNGWLQLMSVPGTVSNVTFSVTPGEMYYSMTGSNWWGESDFSNVCKTPGKPGGGKLSLQ